MLFLYVYIFALSPRILKAVKDIRSPLITRKYLKF